MTWDEKVHFPGWAVRGFMCCIDAIGATNAGMFQRTRRRRWFLFGGIGFWLTVGLIWLCWQAFKAVLLVAVAVLLTAAAFCCLGVGAVAWPFGALRHVPDIEPI